MTFDHVETVGWIALAIMSVVLAFGSAGHALLWKRDPRSTLGWIGISLTLPLFGALFYWSFGVNRVRRTAVKFVFTGKRLGSSGAFRAAPPAFPVDTGSDHLHELRVLADKVTRRPLLPGNAVRTLVNGEAAYPPMLEAIESAKHSVHLSTYIFDSDGAGREFIRALDAAALRGVSVRVIIDALGEKYSWPRARTLFRGPVKVGRFLPLRRGLYMNLRTHRKVLVVDGSTGFTGGMNLGDRHMVTRVSRAGPVHDLHFEVRGPVVSDLQKVFLEDWYFCTREMHDDERCFPHIPEVGEASARVIDDGPDEPARKLHWMILGALNCATRKVRIMTPYFIPDRSLLAALGTAALRGVQVQLLLPEKNNIPLMHWAARSYLWELLPYGIEIRYQPPPFVHSKLFLVDDLWSLIGSANLDPRSLRLNFELNVEVYDDATARALAAHFDESWARSRRVTMDELDSRGLASRLRDGAAKLLSPYL